MVGTIRRTKQPNSRVQHDAAGAARNLGATLAGRLVPTLVSFVTPASGASDAEHSAAINYSLCYDVTP